jgi:hypothetical protein
VGESKRSKELQRAEHRLCTCNSASATAKSVVPGLRFHATNLALLHQPAFLCRHRCQLFLSSPLPCHINTCPSNWTVRLTCVILLLLGSSHCHALVRHLITHRVGFFLVGIFTPRNRLAPLSTSRHDVLTSLCCCGRYITTSHNSNISSFDSNKPTILLLHSYHLDSTWTRDQFRDERLVNNYNMLVVERSCCIASSTQQMVNKLGLRSTFDVTANQ